MVSEELQNMKIMKGNVRENYVIAWQSEYFINVLLFFNLIGKTIEM